MTKKQSSKKDINGPKVWLIIGAEKKGPYLICEVATEIERGTLHLSDKGSYDGTTWQALGQMSEFNSLKMDVPPTRPVINGDATRRISISDIIAINNSSPQKKRERSQKKQKRVLHGVFLAAGCCVIVLAWAIHGQSNDKSVSKIEVKQELKIQEPKRLTSSAPKKENNQQAIESLPQMVQEWSPDSSQDTHQDAYQDEREMNAAAKETNFTRYPAGDDIEEYEDIWRNDP